MLRPITNTKFWQCDHGEPVHQNCPKGTYFNPKLWVCDWPEHAGCTAKPNNPCHPKSTTYLPVSTAEPTTGTFKPETTTYEPETTPYEPETTTSKPETTTSKPELQLLNRIQLAFQCQRRQILIHMVVNL